MNIQIYGKPAGGNWTKIEEAQQSEVLLCLEVLDNFSIFQIIIFF